MNASKCPDCGALLPADSPARLCSVCLFKLGEMVFEAGSSIVRTVAFSPDGTALAGTPVDDQVRVWQAPVWQEIQADPSSAKSYSPAVGVLSPRTGSR